MGTGTASAAWVIVAGIACGGWIAFWGLYDYQTRQLDTALADLDEARASESACWAQVRVGATLGPARPGREE